jgi:hypothetical protein
LDIDTDTIRRLRDSLIDAPASEGAESGPRTTDAMKSAIVRRLEPFAETMYLVMVADGETDPVELDALIASLGILCGGRLSEEELRAMVDGFGAGTRPGGPEARIAQLGAMMSRDRDDREMAFTLAAVIALADDAVASGEHSMLELVGEYYGISSKRATEILNGVG